MKLYGVKCKYRQGIDGYICGDAFIKMSKLVEAKHILRPTAFSFGSLRPCQE